MMEQQSLWQQGSPKVRHDLIEVHYERGKRRWVCCANLADWNPETERAIKESCGETIYGGFVYGVATDPCPVCIGKQPHWL